MCLHREEKKSGKTRKFEMGFAGKNFVIATYEKKKRGERYLDQISAWQMGVQDLEQREDKGNLTGSDGRWKSPRAPEWGIPEGIQNPIEWAGVITGGKS